MKRMLRPLAIGIAAGLVFTGIALGIGSLAGLPENLYGSVVVVGSGVASVTAVYLDGRARGLLPRKR